LKKSRREKTKQLLAFTIDPKITNLPEGYAFLGTPGECRLYAVSILDLDSFSSNESMHTELELWLADDDDHLLSRIKEEKSISDEDIECGQAEIEFVFIGTFS